MALWILLAAQGTVFVEQDGVVSMEAERAAPARGWIEVEGKSGKALQDDGHGSLSFNILFSRGGKYYVWFLCRDQGNTETNDCFVTLDRERLYAVDDKSRPDGIRSAGSAFKWVCQPKGPGSHTPRSIGGKPVYALVPGPGLRTLKISHRSKGFVVDKIVLALDGTSAPEGDGPPETLPPARRRAR